MEELEEVQEMEELDEVQETMDEVQEMKEEEEMDKVQETKEEKEMTKEKEEMDKVQETKEEGEMEEVQEMQEVRQVARIYYERLPVKMKKKAANYFKMLDKNGDESVNYKELEEFLKKKGLTNHVPENLFELIDENHDGALDFMECVTLYYMNEVIGINLCQKCRACLRKNYFVCVNCYNKPFYKSYNICPTCYETKNFQHNHSGFLECNTLLQQVRHRRTFDVVTELLKEAVDKSEELTEVINETIDKLSSCVTM